MKIIKVKPTKKDWIEWATSKKIAPAIISFVKRHGFKSFSPREWNIIDAIGKKHLKRDLTTSEVRFLLLHNLLHKNIITYNEINSAIEKQLFLKPNA
jgi:hypothetical protein